MPTTISHRLDTARRLQHRSPPTLVVQDFSPTCRLRYQHYHVRHIITALARHVDCPYHRMRVRFKTRMAIPIHRRCTLAQWLPALQSISLRTIVSSVARLAQFSHTADAILKQKSNIGEGHGTLAPT